MLKIQPERLFSIQQEADFQALAMSIFQYQATHIPVYQQYLNALKIDPANEDVMYNIAYYFQYKGDYKAAIETYKKLLSKNINYRIAKSI